MKKLSFFLMAMLFSVMSFAAESLLVTLDFSKNTWGLPVGSANKTTATVNYTNGDYTITLAGGGSGHYYNNDGYLIFGKSGATLTLPAFDFKTTKIVVTGRTGASASVLQNIYVGATAVSTQTKGAAVTNTYAIAEDYQAAGNVYVLKVTSSHNTQIVKMEIYGEEGGEQGEKVDAPTFSVTETNFNKAFDLTISSAEGTTLKYTTDNTDPKTSETAVSVETNTANVAIPAKSTVVNAVAVKGDLVSVTSSIVYAYVNSAETAYTVAEAMEVIDAGLGLANELYVKGEISEIEKFDANYGSITYWIKDEEDNKFECYSGLGLNKAKFTSVDDLVVGSKVVVCGVMKKFNTIYEFNYNNYIVSLELPVAKYTVTVTAENGTVEGDGVYEEGKEATLTATPAEGYEFVNWTSGETEVSTANPFTFTVTSDTTLVANFKEVVVEEPVEAKLYLTPNANWNVDNARFAAYFFGNGETWVSMTKVAGETNLYEVAVPTTKVYPNVIFCRMNPAAAANNWDNKWNQTDNLVIPTDGKNHYTVKENTWDKGGGTWSVWPLPVVRTYVDVTITVTANAPASIKWANAGDKLADATDYVAMTAGENNTYTYTLAQVDEATGVDYTIKVGDFVSVEQNTSKNVTIDFKDLLPQVAVQGVNNWDGTDKMTIADDYLTASITLPLVAKKYDLKLTVGGAWKGHKNENHITREKNSSVFKNDDGNGSITADIAGDYVFTYTYATQTLTVTYPELAPVYNVTVANATVSTMGQNIVLSGNWEEKLLTVSLWQGGATQGFGTYAAEDYAPIFLGTAELTPTSEGVYTDNGDNTFTFTATATDAEGAIYNITLTGANPAAVEPETVEIEATVPFNVENGELYIDACEEKDAWCLNFTISGYDGYGNYEVAGLYSTDNDYSVFGTLNVSYDESQETDMIMGTLKTADESLVVHVTLYKEAGEDIPAVPVEISNLTTSETQVGEVKYLQLMGSNDMEGVELMLFIPDYTGENKEYALDLNNSSLTLGGTELTLVEGALTKSTADEKGDVFAGRVVATAEEEGETVKVALDLTMWSAPAIEIEIEDATCVVEQYPLELGSTEMADMLIMTADWTSEDGVVYPVVVNVREFDATAFGVDHDIDFEIGRGETFLGMGDGVAAVFVEEGVVSIEAEVTAYNGTAFSLMISGKLPQDPGTGLDNVKLNAKPVKMIKNGQLIIIKNGVEYNVQGAILK